MQVKMGHHLCSPCSLSLSPLLLSSRTTKNPTTLTSKCRHWIRSYWSARCHGTAIAVATSGILQYTTIFQLLSLYRLYPFSPPRISIIILLQSRRAPPPIEHARESKKKRRRGDYFYSLRLLISCERSTGCVRGRRRGSSSSTASALSYFTAHQSVIPHSNFAASGTVRDAGEDRGIAAQRRRVVLNDLSIAGTIFTAPFPPPPSTSSGLLINSTGVTIRIFFVVNTNGAREDRIELYPHIPIPIYTYTDRRPTESHRHFHLAQSRPCISFFLSNIDSCVAVTNF